MQYQSALGVTWLLLDVDGDAKADGLVILEGQQTGFGNFVL